LQSVQSFSAPPKSIGKMACGHFSDKGFDPRRQKA
jgi:hypothetical protein